VELILLRVKTGEGYILCNKNKPSNSMLLSSEQIKHKQTFLKAIEVVMIMKWYDNKNNDINVDCMDGCKTYR
jgi:hypothetical protein